MLLAMGIYAVAAVILTWPLGLHLSDHLVASPDPFANADSPLNAWILSWAVHALTHFPTRLFAANIFYPAPDALAFSDTLLGNQVLFAPVYAVTGDPVFSYNVTLLGAFVLNGLSLALLVRAITGQAPVALVAGFVYAFAPLRFPHLIHLQLLSAWWAPLAFLALDAWLREPRMSRLAGVVLAVWAQFLSSVYLGIMLAVLLVPYAVWRGWPERGRLATFQGLCHLAAAGFLGTAMFLPVIIPYLRTQAQWGQERGLEVQVALSAKPESFLAASQSNWLYGDLTRPFRQQSFEWESSLFIGLIPLGLALTGLIPWRHSGNAKGVDTRMDIRGYLLAGGLGILLSLGPFLTWGDASAAVPLPYLGLFLWAPGFRALRVPARFALVALVPLAVAAGVGTARLLAWIRTRQPAAQRPAAMLAVVVLLVGITVESLHTPILLQPVKGDSAGDLLSAWLAESEEKGAILEIPFSPSDPTRDALRVFRSTQHWAPMVNGYSGFRPPSYFELASLVERAGWSGRLLEALEALGVRTLVVHLDELPMEERRLWGLDPPWSPQIEPTRSAPGVRLFRVKPTGVQRSRLRASLAIPPALPAADQFRVGLHLEPEGNGPWVNPGPLGRQPARIRWMPVAGSPPSSRSVPVDLPTALLAGQAHTTVLPLATPETPGTYRLELEGAEFRVAQEVSLEDPSVATDLPRAAITWIGLAPHDAATGQWVEIGVQIRNMGNGIWRELGPRAGRGMPLRRLAQLGGVALWWGPAQLPGHGSEWTIWGAGDGALWLGTPRSYLGKFILRGRWLRDGQPVSVDFLPLPQDVFPGQSVDLRWATPAPPDPGSYVLELALKAPSQDPLEVGDQAVLRVPMSIRPRAVPEGSGPA
jgi:hypothetical protein